MKKLEDISKNNPFKVPENYFEELPGKIIEKTNQPAPLRLNFKWAKISGVAAVLSIATFLSVLYFINNKNEVTQIKYNDNAFIEAYVDESTIVNAMVEDTSVVISDKNNNEYAEIDEENLDYAAESLDYETLLAEL